MNGCLQYQSAQIDPETHQPQFLIDTLTEALNDGNIQNKIKESKFENENGFIALNSAMLHHGACIHIDKNVKLENPILLIYLSVDEQKDTMNQYRNLIIMDENSEAKIIEKHISLENGSVFNNHVTEVFLEKSAKLETFKVQNESLENYQVSHRKVHQSTESFYRFFSTSVGAKLYREDIQVSFEEENAECDLRGIYLGEEEQHHDFHILVNHNKPHCRSHQVFRGILGDESRGVFNGKVYVEKDAQKTDASQSNKNLLLSDKARVDTKPELEIYADDVKCAHGATVGQLDEEALFYLKSRGISEKLASQLMARGFVTELIEDIESDFIKNELEDVLNKKLEAQL